MRPQHSWATLGGMTFFHSCNRSGEYSSSALDLISKFAMVTIEKGQGFDDEHSCAKYGTRPPCAEAKISAQLRAVKSRRATIATVFYLNLVLDWHFYRLHAEMEQHPGWQLHNSHTHHPVRTFGDAAFNPPLGGMHVYNHADPELREVWKRVCVASGADGCFSDSSQAGSHRTDKFLSSTDRGAYEEGKVRTMSELTVHFGGEPGKPYGAARPSGVLIGKHASQLGINSFQMEKFLAAEESIMELMEGVRRGYLVQAHAQIEKTVQFEHGCVGRDAAAFEHVVAAFLIGAGPDCYLGFGPWISNTLEEVQQLWCGRIYDRPLGEPLGPSTRRGSVYFREFASGSRVEFDTASNHGTIRWRTTWPASASPSHPPARPPTATFASSSAPIRQGTEPEKGGRLNGTPHSISGTPSSIPPSPPLEATHPALSDWLSAAKSSWPSPAPASLPPPQLGRQTAPSVARQDALNAAQLHSDGPPGVISGEPALPLDATTRAEQLQFTWDQEVTRLTKGVAQRGETSNANFSVRHVVATAARTAAVGLGCLIAIVALLSGLQRLRPTYAAPQHDRRCRVPLGAGWRCASGPEDHVIAAIADEHSAADVRHANATEKHAPRVESRWD